MSFCRSLIQYLFIVYVAFKFYSGEVKYLLTKGINLLVNLVNFLCSMQYICFSIGKTG